jgi:hypothetical protein
MHSIDSDVRKNRRVYSASIKKPLEFTWQVVQKRPLLNDTEVEGIVLEEIPTGAPQGSLSRKAKIFSRDSPQ